MLGLSVAATLGANLAYGARFGLTGALLSGWPAVAFVGSAELSIGMVRRTRRAVPAAVPPPVPAVVPAPCPTLCLPPCPQARQTRRKPCP